VIITLAEPYLDAPPGDGTPEGRRWHAGYGLQGPDEFSASIITDQFQDFSTGTWYRHDDPAVVLRDPSDPATWTEIDVRLVTAEGPEQHSLAAPQEATARDIIRSVLEVARATATGPLWIRVD
jgi:hypothetical protein